MRQAGWIDGYAYGGGDGVERGELEQEAKSPLLKTRLLQILKRLISLGFVAVAAAAAVAAAVAAVEDTQVPQRYSCFPVVGRYRVHQYCSYSSWAKESSGRGRHLPKRHRLLRR